MAPSKAIFRGSLNTDNTCTALIGYSLNLDTSTVNSQLNSFITYKNGQAFAVEYVLAWAPVPLSQVADASGFPAYHPQVSWLKYTTGPFAGQDAYVAGQACAGTNVSDPASMPTMPVTGDPYNADGINVKAEMCIAGVVGGATDGTIQFLVELSTRPTAYEGIKHA
jgi:hypothetical protein